MSDEEEDRAGPQIEPAMSGRGVGVSNVTANALGRYGPAGTSNTDQGFRPAFSAVSILFGSLCRWADDGFPALHYGCNFAAHSAYASPVEFR
ncbi:unnamed protein product [Protopolystoma xenopodis]|uniref:Uncharacterized protein n=1 Tax=Protopolystoma xenopodis TaxID=117903 RepID=A0A448XK52_9PLAT|nr:unnamed protein product [Protopolystoma xenopodis]